MTAHDRAEATGRAHRLDGCRPEPLAGYLKALGVMRLVAEQADAEATGCWRGDAFELTTTLDRETLLAFLLDRYRPTPLVAPWNRGSGFHEGGSSPKAEETLAAVADTVDSRLAPMREAIAAGREVYREARAAGWDEKKDKHQWVQRCRARLPESALDWLDAAAIVVGDEAAYPPLAGSGGVFGRLDISVTFIQRVLDVLALRSQGNAPDRDRSARWLRGALLAEPVDGEAVSIGQFHPGASGGVGTDVLDENRSVVNPWDVVLLFEGALLFAAAAARRLSAERDRHAAMPFMVAASPMGYTTSAEDERARGEVWAPLWQRPAGLAEIRHLLAEGRAQWRGRQARNGLEVAQAVASLGTDRGISEFARHAIVERFGQSDFAVPAGRFPARPRREVPLVERVDKWAARGRGLTEAPASFQLARRRLDDALFALARSGGPHHLQAVLIAAADVEEIVGRAQGRLRDRIPPLGGLAASGWLPHLDDSTVELRLAAALASQHDDDAAGLRRLLSPVEWRGGWRWREDATAPVRGLEVRDLHQVLGETLWRRGIEAQQAGRADRQSTSAEQAAPPDETELLAEMEPTASSPLFAFALPAGLADVIALVEHRVDVERLRALLRGLLRLDWRGVRRTPWSLLSHDGWVDPALARLAPFFQGRSLTVDWLGGEEPLTVDLTAEAAWPAQLIAGRAELAVAGAVRRLRMAQLRPLAVEPARVAASAAPGHSLAAALLCPLTSGGARLLLRRACPPEVDDETGAGEPDAGEDVDESANVGTQAPTGGSR